MRIKVPVSVAYAMYPVTAAGSQAVCIAHPFRAYTSTRKWSPLGTKLYQAYANLYEEVKCIGAKVQVSVVTPLGTSSIPALEVYTAWDRRTGTSENGSLNSEDLAGYGSCQQFTAVSNSVAKFVRSCYARDLMEKAQWHDSSLVEGTSVTDSAFEAAGANPNFFCPGLYVGFKTPGLADDQVREVDIMINAKYYYVFRNPGFGASAASKSAVRSVEPVMRASAPEFEVEDLDLAGDEDVQADIIAQELAAKRATVKKTATKIVTPKK